MAVANFIVQHFRPILVIVFMCIFCFCLLERFGDLIGVCIDVCWFAGQILGFSNLNDSHDSAGVIELTRYRHFA